jgi:hypothetical protein
MLSKLTILGQQRMKKFRGVETKRNPQSTNRHQGKIESNHKHNWNTSKNRYTYIDPTSLCCVWLHLLSKEILLPIEYIPCNEFNCRKPDIRFTLLHKEWEGMSVIIIDLLPAVDLFKKSVLCYIRISESDVYSQKYDILGSILTFRNCVSYI